jgi:hypothetical protein
MIFCARATRGRGLPSRGLMARHGKSIAKQSEGGVGEKYLPVGGRVKKLRAVKGSLGPFPLKSGIESEALTSMDAVESSPHHFLDLSPGVHYFRNPPRILLSTCLGATVPVILAMLSSILVMI